MGLNDEMGYFRISPILLHAVQCIFWYFVSPPENNKKAYSPTVDALFLSLLSVNKPACIMKYGGCVEIQPKYRASTQKGKNIQDTQAHAI